MTISQVVCGLIIPLVNSTGGTSTKPCYHKVTQEGRETVRFSKLGLGKSILIDGLTVLQDIRPQVWDGISDLSGF